MENTLIQLPEGAARSLPDFAGERVVSCVEGLIWITEEGRGQDLVLHPGEAVLVAGRRKIVVQALSRCRLSISTPTLHPAHAWAVPGLS